MAFSEMGKWARGMVAGMALGAGAEAQGAEIPKPPSEPTEQAAFTPEIIKPEWRKLRVISAEDLVPVEHLGFEPQEIPGNKYQYIEITPVGWHKQRTPEGSIFVKDCPAGFHEVRTLEGTQYVQDNPDGSDKIQTIAEATSITHGKSKGRKSGD